MAHAMRSEKLTQTAIPQLDIQKKNVIRDVFFKINGLCTITNKQNKPKKHAECTLFSNSKRVRSFKF